MKKINEIFYSLQGEGFHTGTPAIFIRFSGCNLHCSFCDTQHQTGNEMTDDEIISEVTKYKYAPLIVLTGGEPSLFIDEYFIAKLKRATNAIIAIETNGTHSIPSNIDWITLSPKYGFPGAENAEVTLKKCDELKVVFLGQDINEYLSIPASYYFLQPCFSSDEEECKHNLKSTVQTVMENPKWRLSLQTHRILNIR